jgi:hypothetical protein
MRSSRIKPQDGHIVLDDPDGHSYYTSLEQSLFLIKLDKPVPLDGPVLENLKGSVLARLFSEYRAWLSSFLTPSTRNPREYSTSHLPCRGYIFPFY